MQELDKLVSPKRNWLFGLRIFEKIKQLVRLFLGLDLWELTNTTEQRVHLAKATAVNVVGAAAKAGSALAISTGFKMIATRVATTVILGFEMTPLGLIFTGIVLGGIGSMQPIVRRWLLKSISHDLSRATIEETLKTIHAIPIDDYENLTDEPRANVGTLYYSYEGLTNIIFTNIQPNILNATSGVLAACRISPMLGLVTASYTAGKWLLNEYFAYLNNLEERQKNAGESALDFFQTTWRNTDRPTAIRNYGRSDLETGISLNKLDRMENDYTQAKNSQYEPLLLLLSIAVQFGYIGYLAHDGIQPEEIADIAFMLTHFSQVYAQVVDNGNSIINAQEPLAKINNMKKQISDLKNKIHNSSSLQTTYNNLIKLSSFAHKPNNESAISFENVCYRYPSETSNQFKNLNFEIKRNELVVVTGESGVGKTTLLKLMSGLLTPSSGICRVFGLPTMQSKLFDHITYITQSPDLQESRPVIFNMLYAIASDELIAEIYNMNAAQIKEHCNTTNDKFVAYNKCLSTLKLLKLEELSTRDETHLSGGQLQRIAFARAIAKGNPIILFDEVTSNLDITSAKIIADVIMKLTHITRIVITHQPELFDNCTHLMMDGSEVRFLPPTNQSNRVVNA